MRTCAKFASVILLLNIIFPLKLAAQQLSGEVGYSLLYTDNPFRTSTPQEEFVNFVQPSLTFKPFPSELYLGYSFGYSRFRNLSDRSYYYNSGELNYAFRLGVDTTEDENISLGASYMKASNNSGDGLYSYGTYSVFANGKYFLDDNLLVTAGYSLSGKNYPSLYDLSYTLNSGFLRYSLFLETKTSLFLELQLGNKSYSVTSQTLVTIDRNRPMMGGQSMPLATYLRADNLSTSITQLRIMPKVSQALFTGVGANLHYTWRRNLGRSSAISLSEFIYSDDEDLWDDPFSFESDEIGSEWTCRLPWATTMKLSAEQSRRNYIENLAETGTVAQRKDTRTEFWIGLNKEFTDLPLISNLEAGIEFMRVMNRSNESTFTYNNNIAMFHIGLSF